MFKKINLEYIFLTVFVFIFFFIGLANMWDNNISHDFPYAYLASDGFQHESNSQYVKDGGKVQFSPFYLAGGYKDVYTPHPPQLWILSAIFSKFSGLEAYDSIYFLVYLFIVVSSIIMYLIIRQFSKNLAIISLPLSLLVLANPFRVGLFWGQWLYITGAFFMVCVFWYMSKSNLNGGFIVLSLFLASTMLSHPPEAVFSVFFVLASLVVSFIKKRLSRDLIKNVILGGIISFLLSFFYINIFLRSVFLVERVRGIRGGKILTQAVGFPFTISLFDFKIYAIFILTGILLFFFYKKFRNNYAGIIGIFAFIIGYANYIGLGKRAFATRFFWPIYFSLFFGLIIYFIMKLIIKRLSVVHALLISILFIGLISAPLYSQTKTGSGIMNKYDWSALNWIKENLKEDDIYYILYSDTLSQAAAIYNSKRVAFLVSTDKYIESIKENKIKATYQFALVDSWEVLLCDRGFFSYGYYVDALHTNKSFCNPDYIKYKSLVVQENLCNMGYYYFSKAASQPILAQYNLAIRGVLLKNDWIKEVYSNELVSILKNSKPGVDCIGNITA